MSGLGDDPRNLQRKSVSAGRENGRDPLLSTDIQGDGACGGRCFEKTRVLSAMVE